MVGCSLGGPGTLRAGVGAGGGESGMGTTARDDERLIDRYIDPDTGRYAHGRADARLRESGTHVWALIGHLRAVVGEESDQPTPEAIGQLAEDYGLDRGAV